MNRIGYETSVRYLGRESYFGCRFSPQVSQENTVTHNSVSIQTDIVKC